MTGPASFYLPIFNGYQRFESLVDAYRKTMKRMIAPHLQPNVPVTRMIKPSDVGLSTQQFEFNFTGAGEAAMIDGYQVPDKKAITILGFVNRTTNPVVAGIRVKDGTGAYIRDWYVAHAWAQEYPAFLLSDEEVFSVGPTNVFTINGVATGAGTEYLDILGIIVEALGKTITKEPAKLIKY